MRIVLIGWLCSRVPTIQSHNCELGARLESIEMVPMSFVLGGSHRRKPVQKLCDRSLVWLALCLSD